MECWNQAANRKAKNGGQKLMLQMLLEELLMYVYVHVIMYTCICNMRR